MDLERLAEQLMPLARRAGSALLRYYADIDALDIQTKSNQTPLTEADLASHDIIVAGLRALYPDTPVLSEEDARPLQALHKREDWPLLWLVDPLDGTREFLDRSDDFCINIALVVEGEARFGLIYLPVTDTAYWGMAGGFAWRQTGAQRIKIACRPVSGGESLTLIASRKRSRQALHDLEQHLRGYFARVDRLGVGSAVKFCRVAEGAADVYASFGPTHEWDTAAGQALIEAAGGSLFSLSRQSFQYNCRASLLNGGFYVVGDPGVDWLPLLPQQP